MLISIITIYHPMFLISKQITVPVKHFLQPEHKLNSSDWHKMAEYTSCDLTYSILLLLHRNISPITCWSSWFIHHVILEVLTSGSENPMICWFISPVLHGILSHKIYIITSLVWKPQLIQSSYLSDLV